MHACGHDGHTSALLTFMHRLKRIESHYNLIIIFQHSEEEGSGAREIMKVLEKESIDAIYGFHIMPDIEKHKIVSSDHLLTSGSYEIDIEIIGKSAHIANKEEGIDSIYIGSLLIDCYRGCSEGLIHIGIIQGGTIRNGVSDYTLLKGTIRGSSESVLNHIKSYIEDIHNKVMKEYNCIIHTYYRSHYYPLINNNDLYNQLSQSISIEKIDKVLMYAEDFSYYLKTIPGLFLFIGTASPYKLHTPSFIIDPDILISIVNIYEIIVTQ